MEPRNSTSVTSMSVSFLSSCHPAFICGCTRVKLCTLGYNFEQKNSLSERKCCRWNQKCGYSTHSVIFNQCARPHQQSPTTCLPPSLPLSFAQSKYLSLPPTLPPCVTQCLSPSHLYIHLYIYIYIYVYIYICIYVYISI